MKLRSIQTLRGAAFAIALVFSTVPAHAQPTMMSDNMLKKPSVPSNLEAPTGTRLFLKTQATGTQNYICLPSGWTFVGPQATLFVNMRFLHNEIPYQVATHFLSSNPEENGTARPSWQSSIDTSLVSAKSIANSSDPQYVDQGAIQWPLLQVVLAKRGPAGGSLLSDAAYIQRVHTTGGMMPAGACIVGEMSLVPYTADYYFYKMNE